YTTQSRLGRSTGFGNRSFARRSLACQRLADLVCNWVSMSDFLKKPSLMSPLFRSFGSLLLLLISAAVVSAQQVSPGSVRLIEADGTVEVKRINSAVWDKASTEAPYNNLNPGDELRTGNRSRAAVMLSDKSVVRVGEAGRIQVLEKPKKKAGFSLF